jgi:hypothetical protein
MNNLDHAGLLALAKELRRPLYTLAVTSLDPFTAGQGHRRQRAEWFAKLWQRFDIQPGAHLRRIHYVLISQAQGTVLMPDGSPYLNVDRPCFDMLNNASLDARYLGLVPATDLVDRRNAEPTLCEPVEAEDAGLAFTGGLPNYELAGFEVPQLTVNPPAIPQRFLVEIWCEKSTMNDVLLPFGERYGVNVVTGAGELSLTRCVELVERAETDGRPVRILYVSDFDPAGASMPVAVARKIEWAVYDKGADLDIQVRPIVLTHEQCVQYHLPRTPIKETEGRAAVFEARFGEGATELDALEALHPGELERILQQEINRYYDADLEGSIEDLAGAVGSDLDEVNATVRKRHAKAIADLKAEQKKLVAAVKAFEKKAGPVLDRIREDLEAEAPDVADYDWPEPDDGDDDDDPLFDSTREFVEQVDRYKNHQGKPTEGVAKHYRTELATCIVCNEEFPSTVRAKIKVCSRKCEVRHQRARVKAGIALRPKRRPK